MLSVCFRVLYPTSKEFKFSIVFIVTPSDILDLCISFAKFIMFGNFSLLKLYAGVKLVDDVLFHLFPSKSILSGISSF